MSKRGYLSNGVAVAGAVCALLLGGCASLDPTLTDEEREVLKFNVEGIYIGDVPGKLAVFSQVQKVPIKIDGMDVYEVYNPIPQISNIEAWFYNNKLRKLEIRYFNGPGVSTLERAGGWVGIRDYLMERFGPPSRFGNDVPVAATQKGLQARYAKFNGEWIFSRVKRRLNFIAMADDKGGVGVVTIQDTTPIPPPVQPIDRGRTATGAPASTAARASTAPRIAVQPTTPTPGF